MTWGPTLRDLAFEVCTAFQRAKIQAVLSGGGAATIYAPDAYQSHDLDFIADFYGVGPVGLEVIRSLGFESKGRVYAKPGVYYTLDFPPGPLAVGAEVLTRWDSLKEGDRVLHILRPTDCVKDRLAAYIHWRDESSLDQALAVARRQTVSLDEIGKWCSGEGGERHYAQFLARLQRT